MAQTAKKRETYYGMQRPDGTYAQEASFGDILSIAGEIHDECQRLVEERLGTNNVHITTGDLIVALEIVAANLNGPRRK